MCAALSTAQIDKDHLKLVVNGGQDALEKVQHTVRVGSCEPAVVVAACPAIAHAQFVCQLSQCTG